MTHAQRATLSPSFPFMSIAKHYGLPYGIVLTYADYWSTRDPNSSTVWHAMAAEALIKPLIERPTRKAFLADIAAALARLSP